MRHKMKWKWKCSYCSLMIKLGRALWRCPWGLICALSWGMFAFADSMVELRGHCQGLGVSRLRWAPDPSISCVSEAPQVLGAGMMFVFCASQQRQWRLVRRGLREAGWGPQLLRVPLQPPHQLRHPDASGAPAGEAQQGREPVCWNNHECISHTLPPRQ